MSTQRAVKGIAQMAGFYVECPRCHDLLTDPRSGSQLIGRDSIDRFRGDLPAEVARKSGVVVDCFGCGSRVQIPATVVRAVGT